MTSKPRPAIIVLVDSEFFKRIFKEGNETKIKCLRGVPQDYTLFDCRVVDYGRCLELKMVPPDIHKNYKAVYEGNEELVAAKLERIE